VAVRETLSETGAHIAVRQYLGRRLHPVTKVMCEYFFCEFLGGEVENLDVEENLAVAWARKGHIDRYVPVDSIFGPVLTVIEGTD
jgi:8-oxo-dGTP diphosphatase